MKRLMIPLLVLLLVSVAGGQIVTGYNMMLFDTLYIQHRADDSCCVPKAYVDAKAATGTDTLAFQFNSKHPDSTKTLYANNASVHNGYLFVFGVDTASADALPAVGAAGSGLLFSAKRGSFRAGYNRTALWDTTPSYHSFAFGLNSYAADSAAAIGCRNLAALQTAIVGGGHDNLASGYASAVIGGNNSLASGARSGVFAGQGGDATNTYAVVLGGSSGEASGTHAATLGGVSGTASGDYAVVSGGYSNTASGDYAVVSGGSGNTASGEGAIATGLNGTASGDYAILMNLTETPNDLAQDSSFSIMPGINGGVGIGTLTPSVELDVAGDMAATGTATLQKSTVDSLTIVNHEVWTQSDVQSITAADGVTAAQLESGRVVLIVGSEGDPANVDISKLPNIVAGAPGQVVVLCGTNDAGTVKFEDEGTEAGSGLELGATSRTLGDNDQLCLRWNGTEWLECWFVDLDDTD